MMLPIIEAFFLHLSSVQLNYATLFSLQPMRYGSMVKNDLTCEVKPLEIFKELETSAQMLFPWTPVMFLPGSDRKNNVGFLT